MRITQKRLMKTWKTDLLTHKKILTMISIALFCCFEKVFTHINVDDWKKITETSLPEKEDFYSQLNMEDTTDEGYTHAKSLQKNWNKKFIGISSSVCAKQYIIVSWCIWQLSKHVSRDIIIIIIILYLVSTSPGVYGVFLKM